MLSNTIINKFDNEITNIRLKYKIMVDELRKHEEMEIKKVNERKMKEYLQHTKVVQLKQQAYQNYIIGYSKLKKEEIVKKIERRIIEEKLLVLPDDIFNKVGGFLDGYDKIRLKPCCKTLNTRVKVDKCGMMLEKNINDFINIVPKNFDSIKQKVKDINKIYRENKKAEQYDSYIIKIIKHFLNINDKQVLRERKEELIMDMLLFVMNRRPFLYKNKLFALTVYKKLCEIENKVDYFNKRKVKKYKNKMIKDKIIMKEDINN